MFNQLLLNGIIAGSIYALIALGFTVITDIQILILVVSGLLLAALWFIIERTKTGKAIRAVADDPVGASVCGIYSERVILYAFGVGSAFALFSYDSTGIKYR